MPLFSLSRLSNCLILIHLVIYHSDPCIMVMVWQLSDYQTTPQGVIDYSLMAQVTPVSTEKNKKAFFYSILISAWHKKVFPLCFKR